MAGQLGTDGQQVRGSLTPRGRSPVGWIVAAVIVVLVAVAALRLPINGGVPTAQPSARQSSPAPPGSPNSGAEPSDAVPGPRTSPVITAEVLDRPGVPPDLRDSYWFTDFGEAGHVGTTAYILLPEGERILAVEDGLVASTGISDEGGSILLVRNLATGDLQVSLDSPLRVTSATLAGGYLFWAGRPRGVDGPADGGVWAIQLSDSEAEPVQVVAEVPDMTAAGFVERGRFLVSPSGDTIATVVGNMGNTHYDFVDTSSLEITASLDDRIVFGITDDTALAASGGEPPSSFPGLVALDIATGDQIWKRILGEGAELAHVLVVEDFVLLDFRVDAHQLVARLALNAGAYEELISSDLKARPLASGVYLAPELSSSEHLVLLTEFSPGDAVNSSSSGHVAVDVLDVATKELEIAVFEIGRP